ncbi:tRNA lysidine(34) synthetase TilS [Mergibacter septicus]|uniref:tRNA lysidine(34) synthetase TilS n=1 Tax=Mergibacter septicus TaxID=221402 RepID=UPI001C7911BF|nr:tRNA lysidine(34) synthetase TilS [Mergibacter septicus]QDJ13411.1 tRNA lysidine(34) synthetase TilS [Mergibacter septicus]
MSNLVAYLRQQIEQNALTDKAFLIAFSGGADSTALLALFAQLRQTLPSLKVRAIHIHHGLSPNADDWAQHCATLCQQLNIDFLCQKIQLQQSKNLEENARIARYQAIAQIRYNNEIVVTAHHLDDQSETFFLALKRGSGVQGLAAIPTLSKVFDLPLFRPLLAFDKQRLEQYLTEKKLPFIYDESNHNPHFDRNFLRQQILPLLRQRWHNFDRAVQRSAEHCLEQQQLINELLADCLASHLDTQFNFKLANFSHYSIAKQKQLLRLWLAKQQQMMPTQTQLEQILKNVIQARLDAKPQFRLGDKMIRRFQQKLYLTEIFAETRSFSCQLNYGETIQLPDNLGELSCLLQQQKVAIHWQQQHLLLDRPKAQESIYLRFHYSGKVRLTPKSKNKDIKKIWQEYNIPPWQRCRIPLIFYAEQLQAAVGIFQCQ